MKSLEDLEKEYNEKRAKLERELAIAKSMPVPPKRVTAFEPEAWVSYEVPTLGEAIAIMQQFEIAPVSIGRGSATEVKPRQFIKPENVVRVQGPYVCYLKTHTRAEMTKTADAELIFHSCVNEVPIKVIVKFGKDYIGHCDALAANMIEHRSAGGRSLVERKFDLNTAIPRDNFIHWGSFQGNKPTYAEMFYLIADNAVERLTKLATDLNI